MLTEEQRRLIAEANRAAALMAGKPPPEDDDEPIRPLPFSDKEMERIIEQANEAAAKMRGKVRYDPRQPTLPYLAQQLKLVPAGLLGLPVETLANIRDLAKAAAGTAYGEATGKTPPEWLQVKEPQQISGVGESLWHGRPGGAATFASFLGYQPTKPPGPISEATSNVANAIASIMLTKRLSPSMTLPQAGVIGTGAGLGQTAAEHAFPDTPAAGAIGSVIGGFVPSLSPTAHLLRTGADATRAAFGEKARAKIVESAKPVIEDVVKRDVARQIAEYGPATANIERMAALMAKFPGVQPNIGQMTLVPTLVAQSKKMALNPDLANVVQQGNIANRAALAKAILHQQDAPAMGRVVSGMADDIARQSAALADEAARLRAFGQTLRESVPTERHTALGQAMRDYRQQQLAQAQQVVRNLLDRVDEAAAGKTFDATKVVKTVQQTMQNPALRYEPGWMPAVARRIMGLVKEGDSAQQVDIKNLPFRELRAMREAVNEDIRQVATSGTTTARAQLRELMGIRNAIDDAIMSGDPAVRSAYGEFVRYYRDEFAPKFLRGLNIKQTTRDVTGEMRISHENLPKQYFSATQPGAARQYLSLYGGSAEGKDLMQRTIMDRYAREVLTKPNLEAAHQSFINRYREPLRILHEGGINTADDIAALGNAAKKIGAEAAALKAKQQELQKNSFASLVRDKFGARTADQVMADAIKDPRKADMLVARMDQRSAQGMLNWFADDLASAITGAKEGRIGEVVSARLENKNYIYAYRAALEKAYGKKVADQHIAKLGMLDDIARRLDVTELDPFVSLKGKHQIADISAKTGFTVASVWSLIRAIVTGRTSEYHAALVLGGQYATKQLEIMRNDILRKLVTDPKELDAVLTLARAQAPVGEAVSSAAKSLMPTVLDSARKAGAFVGKAATVPLRKTAPTTIAPLAEERIGDEDAIQR